MCLKIKQPWYSVLVQPFLSEKADPVYIRTARRDIKVYKQLTYCRVKNDTGKWIDSWTTPFREHPVTLNSTLEADSFGILGINVHQGIHAYTRLHRIESRAFYAIIPRGTKYIVGQDDDIVALKLHITDKEIAGDKIYKARMKEYY